MNDHRPKIIVLDDDPTGSQTVWGCLLLLQWDVETLRTALQDDSPIFFILTNTRALPPQQAKQVTAEVCDRLKQAIAEVGIEHFIVVSRSDSTLRGHYPIETDVIAEKIGEFDAHFLTPAFFEGGRITRDSVHYLMVDGVATPVAQTEFARDSVFGYRYSYLPDYVAEKTGGRISSEQVKRLLLKDIRAGCREFLLGLNHNQCVVVDGESQADFDRLAVDLLAASQEGKRFLFRSAASLLTSLAELGPQPVAPMAMSEYRPTQQPGVVIVGSHVRKTTQQLQQLLLEPQVEGIEVDVTALQRDNFSNQREIETSVNQQIQQAIAQSRTPVVYTSRQELQFDSIDQRLEFGAKVSNTLMNIVRALPAQISFLISKGGITSNDVLSQGLALTTARLMGQIIPGCSLVVTPAEHPYLPKLPVVLFPGNVGDTEALVTVYRRLIQSR